eukprot:TRINITY_DN117970_c0_g1_i1.p1 TRINITY_DN117970_c0_g1~~TRINITY_DN117970_c0_g1_i1.p1  ORF type:complete len:440 (+),score=101.97 TRINITY_DN117970_c0_g1_i1:72-1391(+)
MAMVETDVLAKKGYYSEMTATFQDMSVKRDEIHKDILLLAEEKLQIEDTITSHNKKLVEGEKIMKRAHKQKIRVEKLLKQLEAGGATARAALRKLQLGKIPLEERVALAREEFRTPVLEEIASSSSLPGQDVTSEDLAMTRADGTNLPVRSYRPPGFPNDPNGSPVIVFFHGQGYVTGDLETHDWLCRALAALAGAAVVSVDYRKPPEVPFPGAFDDAYDSICWISREGLGWKPGAIAVAGDAAGGGLALASCLKARDDPEGPRIALQILFYPWLDVRPDSESMQGVDEEDPGQLLLQDELETFGSMYGPPKEAKPKTESDEHDDDSEDDDEEASAWMKDQRASPLLAASMEKLPRVFLAYAADDLLAGDATRFAERLRKESGQDHLHALPMQAGVGHGFAKHATRPEAYAAVAAAAAFANGALRVPLEGPSSPQVQNR